MIDMRLFWMLQRFYHQGRRG